MADDVERRMAAADRFVERLGELEPAEWREVADATKLNSEFYALALELVNDATQLAGESLASRYDRFLGDLYARIDRYIARLPAERGVPSPHHLAVMAKAATNALLVHNAHGFSVGAFNELVGPFRRVFDLTAASGSTG